MLNLYLKSLNLLSRIFLFLLVKLEFRVFFFWVGFIEEELLPKDAFFSPKLVFFFSRLPFWSDYKQGVFCFFFSVFFSGSEECFEKIPFDLSLVGLR